MPFDIRLHNRRSKAMEIESVYGRGVMDLFYGTPWGRWITSWLLCRPLISKIYGWIQVHPRSRRKIAPFVRQYNIDLDEAVIPPEGFPSFNAFFTRQLKPGIRQVDTRSDRLVSPADSRLQIFPVVKDFSLKVKGMQLTLPQLLGVNPLDGAFEGGLCLSFRLAPCDYHRFGYAREGRQDPVHTINGPLHSVSPLATRHKPDILGTNYRHWCFVHTADAATMIQVEVGAMMVGSIVQHQPLGGTCSRGQEKGYFQFGGSTVLLITQPGRVAMDEDIVHWSQQGIETLVQYGEAVGRVINP
jgi:phosphatidylserine decarboxylase